MLHLREHQRRCSIFLQAAQRGHAGRQVYARELWAKRSKDAARLLSKAAIAKLEIIAAGTVRRVIWKMKYTRAVLKLQSCCRGWFARNSNEYSRRRRIKSKIIRRLQNDSAITKLQRKIKAFQAQKAIALGLDAPETKPDSPVDPVDQHPVPYKSPQASAVSPMRRHWPRLPPGLASTPEQKALNRKLAVSLERIKQEQGMNVLRPADATFAAAVLLQLQRSLFPRHAASLSPLPEDRNLVQIEAAAASFEDLKMRTPFGAFTEEVRLREPRFWQESDEVLQLRAAEEEQRQFGVPFPNLAPDDEEGGVRGEGSSQMKLENSASPHPVPRRLQTFTLIPQVPSHLQPAPLMSPLVKVDLATPASQDHRTGTYVAVAPQDSEVPEACDLPIPWFWIHPIASTDLSVLDLLLPIMQEEDSALLKALVQKRQWLPAARVMRAVLSHLVVDGDDERVDAANCGKDVIGNFLSNTKSFKASLALLVFMLTSANSIIAIASGAEGETQALLLKVPSPPKLSPAAATALMSDAATILGMARALLNSEPLESCKLHPKLQCWVGAVEACLFHHEQRNAAAAEMLVRALVWESKYKVGTGKLVSGEVSRNENGAESLVVAALQSSSAYLRCSITLQLSSVCLRSGDVQQAEKLALQVLDSVSSIDVKKRDEHWHVMGGCAELLLARMLAVSDERAMEAQQWVRKASRSADRVAGPGRKSVMRKREALQVLASPRVLLHCNAASHQNMLIFAQIGAHALLVKAVARAVVKRSGKNELDAAPETGVLPSQ
jgi:hypothetical protein